MKLKMDISLLLSYELLFNEIVAVSFISIDNETSYCENNHT